MQLNKRKDDRIQQLKELCSFVVENFTPEDVVSEDGEKSLRTWCNKAVAYIANKRGFKGFVGKLANRMIDEIKRNPNFAPCTIDTAKRMADEGWIVIAARKDYPHGHVAVVYPERKMIYSGKWRKEVPVLCNVGAHNGVMGANHCFGGEKEPSYYLLLEEDIFKQ